MTRRPACIPVALVAMAAAMAFPLQDAALDNWVIVDQESRFRVFADTHAARTGAASGHISALNPNSLASMIVQQSIRAEDYRGKRVRFSAYLRAENAGRSNGMGIMLFLRSEGGGAILSSHTTGARPVSGTTAWSKREIVLDIPRGSLGMTFGFGAKGPGEFWMDDATIEVVDTTVAVTRAAPKAPASEASRATQQRKLYAAAPTQPQNLGFEKTK